MVFLLSKVDISKSFTKIIMTCNMFLILAGLALSSAAAEPVNRIAHGKLAAAGQFPYMVSLQELGDQQSEPTRGHRCSGALVSHLKVVTTAVCLHNNTASFPELVNQNDFRVFAGSNYLGSDYSADFVRAILSFTVHPDFTGFPALVNDVAVVTLAIAFPRGIVTPLSLPPSNFNPAEFTSCTVAGWGSLNQSNEITVNLRFATKYVYNQNLCTLIYNTSPDSKNILSSMICAVSYDLKSSNCIGDYGNPLVCDNTFTGILSTSTGCRNSTFPEIYTRISNYTSWIRSVSGVPSLINPGIYVLLIISFITGLF